jgi:hypothetical protein
MCRHVPVKLGDHCGLDEGLEIAALKSRRWAWRVRSKASTTGFSGGDGTISPWLFSARCAPSNKPEQIESLGGISVDCGDLDWAR